MKMKMTFPVANSSGITLIEIMITLAIIAILSTIGYPLYSDYVIKSRRTDAKATLMKIMQAQQRSYTANSTYTTDLSTIGYETATEVLSEGSYYKITAKTCGTASITSCVTLTAVPQFDDAECKNMIIDSTGAKSVTGTLATDKCW
jgi:type IV pilus assembly protein PilE